MRFVDSSVFIYAYLRPLKKLSPDLVNVKHGARKIVERIVAGEEAATSIVHISEIANILEARMPIQESLDLLSGLFCLVNLHILDPSRTLYETAIQQARSSNIGANDALAILLMNQLKIKEIYSFNTDFDEIEGVKRIIE